RKCHAQTDFSLIGELERVGQQILENLLQSGRVRADGARQSRVQLDCEVERLLLGHLTERTLDVVADVAKSYLANVNRSGSGLNFREVKNVVDQHQQILARFADRGGEVDLLASQIPIRILG